MQKNKRNTSQKQAILEALEILKFDHPTALDVLRQVRLLDPGVSKATVYRNLKDMADQGLVMRIEAYDFNVHSHSHFKCRVCGKLYDLDENLGMDIKYKCDFVVERVDVILRGKCKDCGGN